MSQTLLMLSGGLDSVTLLHHYHNNSVPTQCVMFRYGQQHAQEVEFARLHCHRMNIVFHSLELPRLRGSTLTGDAGSWVVPVRNSVLLSVACNLAESLNIPRVSFGANADDAEQFPDCRKRFIDAFNESLFQAQVHVRVEAPFLTWNKAKIARLASDMGIKLHEIWTCYQGGKKPCGACPACRKLESAIV